MTAPGTLLMAKMLVPETEVPLTAGRVEMPPMEKEANFLGAISRGTVDGLHLALNVGAMLISFLAMLALVNAIHGRHAQLAAVAPRRWFPSSLQQVFGWVFAPMAWVIGIPWKDCAAIGNLLGTRMVVNEVVAFQQLGSMQGVLDPRSVYESPHLRCAASRISVPSEFKLAESARWRPEQRGNLAQIRHSRDAGRDDGEFDVGLVRRNSFVSKGNEEPTSKAKPGHRAKPGRRRRLPNGLSAAPRRRCG